MAGIFGKMFDMRSKDEKQRDFEAYSKRIFPYGDSHKEKVSEILTALYPKTNIKYLRMYYILLKDEMTGEDAVDFEAAAKKLIKKSMIKVTPELNADLHALLLADFEIDENLNFPSIEEIHEMSKNLVNKE
ncbi:hypothetical protein GCM10023142_13960 [Anaerocolumna aminovalerica]|jgi:hypothetical protein|uniref:Uncharacterized protein n=1 Tax=Anaerocolumna aminovalerica TaxID=1527 RepID=A0A1I5F4K4_9FIRM|nr:hypothetical protein [Anaerocolumna aminovalerica]MBU5332578.1 hypothetical protein [Anaerocolumna aminovalerica]MDU6264912.1 hypothetical protein [Anaerocolumna aminovalerica]SFO18728.1 hypothetical protein SAMN04489757_11235 [Anaerocolumna aminovalerica]